MFKVRFTCDVEYVIVLVIWSWGEGLGGARKHVFNFKYINVFHGSKITLEPFSCSQYCTI